MVYMENSAEICTQTGVLQSCFTWIELRIRCLFFFPFQQMVSKNRHLIFRKCWISTSRGQIKYYTGLFYIYFYIRSVILVTKLKTFILHMSFVLSFITFVCDHFIFYNNFYYRVEWFNLTNLVNNTICI